MLILFLLSLVVCCAELNRAVRLRAKARRLLAWIERTEALCDDFLARTSASSVEPVPEPENVIQVDFRGPGFGKSFRLVQGRHYPEERPPAPAGIKLKTKLKTQNEKTPDSFPDHSFDQLSTKCDPDPNSDR